MVPFGKVEVMTSKILRSPPWLGWPLWNICVTNDHGYVPLVVSTSRSFSHSRLITGFVTRLTRRVPLVKQELLTLPEHLSSIPVFSGDPQKTTDLSQFTDKLYHIILYTSPWSRFKLKTPVVIGTDCRGSYKSYKHTMHNKMAAYISCAWRNIEINYMSHFPLFYGLVLLMVFNATFNNIPLFYVFMFFFAFSTITIFFAFVAIIVSFF